MKVTISIIILCFAIFFIQSAYWQVTALLALTPVFALHGMYWQFVTYMFAHASISHVGFNMIGLFIFGVTMERFLGTRKYLFLYLVSGIGSGLFHILLTGISDVPMLGASGAVFAVLTAYAIKFPDSKIMIFPIVVPIKALYAVGGFVLFSIFAGFTDVMPGTAHFGHLGGILFGAVIMLAWRRMEKRKPENAFDDMKFVWEGW